MAGKTKKILFRWIKVTALLYGLVGIGVYYLQDYIMFHPKVLPGDHQFRFNVPFAEMDVPFSNTDTINLVKFFPKNAAKKGVVLYASSDKPIKNASVHAASTPNNCLLNNTACCSNKIG